MLADSIHLIPGESGTHFGLDVPHSLEGGTYGSVCNNRVVGYRSDLHHGSQEKLGSAVDSVGGISVETRKGCHKKKQYTQGRIQQAG